MASVCPKCDQPLFLLNLRGTELDFCAECRGLWLDAGELEAIMTGAGGEATESLAQYLAQEGTRPTGKPYLCPRCDRPIHTAGDIKASISRIESNLADHTRKEEVHQKDLINFMGYVYRQLGGNGVPPTFGESQ